MVAINALALFAALSSLVIAAPHNSRSRHHDIAARRHEFPVARDIAFGKRTGAVAKRACRPRPAASAPAAAVDVPAENNSDSNNHQAEATQDWSAPPAEEQAPPQHEQAPPQHEQAPPQHEAPPPQQEWTEPAETSHAFAPSNGLISVQDWRCGGAQPSAAEPNGRQDWLNCGLEDGGWNPPHVTAWDLKSVGLDNPHFSKCSPYFEMFTRHGETYGIPPVLLASIALQESGCDFGLNGKAGGENGLMQITHDKCVDGVWCKEPEYNIGAAAAYLKKMTDEAGGNILVGLGRYNGWYPGLTKDAATAAAWQGNCYAQNNLDYHYQLLNGHMQGKDAWQMGRWQNLAHCG